MTKIYLSRNFINPSEWFNLCMTGGLRIMAHFTFKNSFTKRLLSRLLICCFTCISSVFAQTPLPNPDLLPNCPYNIIFVLDESGSIVGSSNGTDNINSQVRNGARDLINSLSGTGSRVAVIEFNSSARRALVGGSIAYQTVNAGYVTAFNSYITRDNNSTASNVNYDPEDCNQCYTNWEAAFLEVQNVIAMDGFAQLVIFFTDGMPTAYINTGGGVTFGTDTATTRQSLLEAIGPANTVKSGGTHIFVVGIPNPNLPEANVQAISGPDKYPTIQSDFTKADYSVSSSQTLRQDLAVIATLICRVDLNLSKTANRTAACPGSQIIFTLTVHNDGPDNAGGVEVSDALPAGYTYISDNGGTATIVTGGRVVWAVGDVNAGAAATLQITVVMNSSGSLKNTAQVSACAQHDLDSTPNNDDGDQSEDDEAFASVSRFPITVAVNATVCEGGSYFVGGALQTQSGIYYDTFTVTSGCDSVVITQLEVSPPYSDTFAVTTCNNEPYFAGGALRNTSGTYRDTFTTSSGCDSVITTLLNVIQIKRSILRVPICQGDSLYAGGYYRTQPGAYYDTLTAANGCDSILTTVVVMPNCDDNYSCTEDFCFAGGCSHLALNCSVIISGTILTETGVPVPEVTVTLSGSDNQTFVTGTDGLYNFSVETGGNYIVTPTKMNDITITNGITTLDFHLIRQHVLGAQLLSSPYQIIAADANLSETVTTLDMNIIRSLVLGNTAFYPSGRLWQFVPSDFIFSDPANPFPFDKSRSYSNISQNYTNQDFIGIKMCDVNNSWNPLIP